MLLSIAYATLRLIHPLVNDMNDQLIHCVILDRDGVINRDTPGQYITSKEAWVPIPGSLDAIAKLNQQGIKVGIATNQSGIARGYYTQADLTEIHLKMTTLLKAVGGHIDYIAFCPHHPNDNCLCRKPKPGLLREVAQHLNIDLAKTYFIGDKSSDMSAAKAAGCQGLFVKTGHGVETLNQQSLDPKTPIYTSLAHAVNALLDG